MPGIDREDSQDEPFQRQADRVLTFSLARVLSMSKRLWRTEPGWSEARRQRKQDRRTLDFLYSALSGR
jgi:type IV secretory pathway TrbF-like protein